MEKRNQRKGIPGSRFSLPLPVGTTAKAMIERQARNPSTVTYTLEITVAEVLRGKAARDWMQRKDLVQTEPAAGFEHLMARIKLKYYPKARGLPEYEPYQVDANQFRAVSGDGNHTYPLPLLSRQPDPALAGATISINETREGWLALQVPTDEKKPLLSFDRDYTESRLTLKTARGVLWFRLW